MQCCGFRGLFKLPSTLHYIPSTRKVVDVIQVTQEDSTKSNVKRALLVAKKKERINLPLYKNANAGEMYHISQFLKHPTGVESILNVNALESYVLIDANIYRCKVPPIQLLNFEVAPVLDLEVSPDRECCTVELLSCKFEGSEIVTSQNKYFAATMKNFITWDDTDSESFLDVDVKLNITLEIYNRPFTLLPVSAVEGPGNLYAYLIFMFFFLFMHLHCC
ncbi:DNA repair protein RAD16 [Bienertia sinuspersici]